MPTVMRYIEAVNTLSSRSNRLAYFEPVRNDDGEPFYFAGSRSALFKVKSKDKYYSLKCFISPNTFLKTRFKILSEYARDRELEFIPNFDFFDNELKVIEREQSLQYPVLITEWIEGESLHKRIEKLCRAGDSEGLQRLTSDMIAVFIRLLSLELIHGDIKFDNILIDKNDSIYIIDWDGCYLPFLDVYPTSEIGTVCFQHPLRTAEHYGFRVDDYSIALIVVILIVLSDNPALYFNSVDKDYILLLPDSILSGESRVYNRLLDVWHYYPLRYKLLSFIGGDKIEMPDLRDVLVRLSGDDYFNSNKETLIDPEDKYTLRRIINKTTHLYGFIDENNKVAVDTMYGDATLFECGMAGVRINANWFFIDRKGNQISELFSTVRDCSEGMFIIKRNGKFGYFSAEKCAIVIEPTFTFASPFRNGIAKVSVDGENYYYIDPSGETK